MDAPVRYIEELRSEMGFYPMWLPADRIELGSVGTFLRGVFRTSTHLADLGIEVKVTAADVKNSFKKHRGMEFRAGSSLSAQLSPGDASVSVSFSADSSYAWAFGAVGARKTEIANLLQVQSAVLEARRTGIWRDEWLLVSEVHKVDVLTVIIAKSRNARGDIRARARLPSPEDVLIAQDLSCRFDANDVFVLENAKKATPLFGLRQVRGLFRKGVEPIRGGERKSEELTLAQVPDAPMYADSGSAINVR